MSKEELIKYLQENLQVEIDTQRDGYNGKRVEIKLTLEGAEISSSLFYVANQ